MVATVAGCADRQPPPSKEAAVLSNEAFHNPVDNRTYIAPNGWKKYEPANPRPEDPARKVKTEQIRLLTSESETAARTDVSDLAAFIGEAERLADAAFGTSGKKFQVLVQFTCKPAGHEVKVAHQGDAPRELLQAYYDQLIAAKKLSVRDGEVSFQLELSVVP